MKAIHTLAILGCALTIFFSVDVAAETALVAAPKQQASPAMQKPTEKVEADLTAAHSALKITPAQEKDWSGYADVRRQDAREVEKRMMDMQKANPPGSAPAHMGVLEMLQQQRTRVGEAETRLDALIAGTKALYAALTPEQRVLADEALMPQRQVMAVATPGAHATLMIPPTKKQ